MEKPKKKVFYGWILVGAMFVSMGMTDALTFSMTSIFCTQVCNDLGFTRTAFMVSQSIITMFALFGNPFFGKLIDKIGVKKVSLIGSVSLVIGYLICSIAKTLPMFYIGYAFLGITKVSCTSMFMAACVAKWFVKDLGKANGILAAGLGVLNMVTVPLVAKIILVAGYSKAYLYLALLSIPTVLLINAVFLTEPEKKGLYPDGLDHPPVIEIANSGKDETGLTLGEAMKTKTLWILGLMNLFYAVAVYGTAQTYNPALQSVGIEPMTAALIVSAVNAIQLLTGVGFGFLADKINPKILLTVTFALLAVSTELLAAFGQGTSMFLLYIFAAIYACAYVGRDGALMKLVVANFGRKNYSAIYGFLLSCNAVGVLVAPLIPSAFYDTTGSYSMGYHVFTIFAVLAIAAAWCIKSSAKKGNI